MSNTIGSINVSSMMGSAGTTQRPDPSKMVSDLFSQIDTEGKGYIDSSDLEEAMSQLSSSDGSSDASATSEELFSAMDSDGDGKVTQTEMSDTLQTLSDSLGFAQGMGGPGATGGMPPPPPSGSSGEDSGYTEDELTSQLDSLTSSDSLSEADQARADLISSIVSNFDEADTNEDGKVDGSEAMTYDQSRQESDSSTSTATASTSSTSSSGGASDAQVMQTIARLMHAYGPSSQAEDSSTASALSAMA